MGSMACTWANVQSMNRDLYGGERTHLEIDLT